MKFQNETPAAFLARQFRAAYYEGQRTGESIEEIARLDVLADVAAQVIADEERKAAADLLAPAWSGGSDGAPAWRRPADAATAIEFARMIQMAIVSTGVPTPTVADVCEYVTAAVHAFEAEYRTTEWGDDLDWCEETEKFLARYTATIAPPWDTEDARREREAEAMRAALRVSGYNVTGLDGCVEVRDVKTGAATLTMECRGDGTCDVRNHAAHRYEKAVPIDTMITYARLMVRA